MIYFEKRLAGFGRDAHQPRTPFLSSQFTGASWKKATGIALSAFLLITTPVRPQPVPGSLEVHWNEGASDCSATPQNPLQV
jgi:hypothetical protein